MNILLQNQLYSWDNLTLAWKNAARGKRGKGAVARFEVYLADNLLALERELREQTYQPGAYESFYIHEPKKRLISAAPFRDRVVHHALCNLTVPFFERKFIFDSYANREGKGTHRSVDRCQQFARKYTYVLSCDVRQFFPAIDHEILRHDVYKMLPDDSLLWLIDRILTSGQGILSEAYDMVYFPGDDLFAASRPRGLPIGNLTSQWWANIYLNAFDQFVKRGLKCKAYVRYVDDFLLFSDNKRELRLWREAMIQFLARYRLTIHESRGHARPVTEGIPFLGFIIFPDHRRLKRRKGIAYQRKLRRLVETGDLERIRASIHGWINHVHYADTYGLRQSVLQNVDLLAGE